MKKIILPALATIAMFGVSACSEPADTTTTDDTAMGDATATDPAMTEPVVTEAPATDDGTSMSIDESGMDATMSDGSTTTTVDVDKDPSMDVTTN